MKTPRSTKRPPPHAQGLSENKRGHTRTPSSTPANLPLLYATLYYIQVSFSPFPQKVVLLCMYAFSTSQWDTLLTCAHEKRPFQSFQQY
jgi:hypothetical protein